MCHPPMTSNLKRWHFRALYCLRQSPSRPDSLRCLPVHLDRWPSRHTTHLYSSFERLNRWRFPIFQGSALLFLFSASYFFFSVPPPHPNFFDSLPPPLPFFIFLHPPRLAPPYLFSPNF